MAALVFHQSGLYNKSVVRDGLDRVESATTLAICGCAEL